MRKLTSSQVATLTVLVEAARRAHEPGQQFTVIKIRHPNAQGITKGAHSNIHPRGYVISHIPEGIDMSRGDLVQLSRKGFLEQHVARGGEYFRITAGGYTYYDQTLAQQSGL